MTSKQDKSKQNKRTAFWWVVTLIGLLVFVLTGHPTDPTKPNPAPSNVRVTPHPTR
jgi:hypothetical protein